MTLPSDYGATWRADCFHRNSSGTVGTDLLQVRFLIAPPFLARRESYRLSTAKYVATHPEREWKYRVKNDPECRQRARKYRSDYVKNMTPEQLEEYKQKRAAAQKLRRDNWTPEKKARVAEQKRQSQQRVRARNLGLIAPPDEQVESPVELPAEPVISEPVPETATPDNATTPPPKFRMAPPSASAKCQSCEMRHTLINPGVYLCRMHNRPVRDLTVCNNWRLKKSTLN